MIGEASGIVPDRGMNILYRVTLNTLMNLTEDGLTRENVQRNTQTQNNSRLGADTPKGILAGMVVKAGTDSGTVIAADGGKADQCDPLEQPLGIAINDAVGYPFESSSGVSSGKCPYIHGAGSVFTTDLYETVAEDGTTALSYSPGDPLYVSQNGFLATWAGSPQCSGAIVVGIVLIAPSQNDPFMAVQMRI